MSRTVHGTPCWECSNFTMGEECECNEHLFCDKSLEEHDKKIRADAINEFVTRFEAEYSRKTVNIAEFRIYQYEMHRLAEEMLKEQK